MLSYLKLTHYPKFMVELCGVATHINRYSLVKTTKTTHVINVHMGDNEEYFLVSLPIGLKSKLMRCLRLIDSINRIKNTKLHIIEGFVSFSQVNLAIKPVSNRKAEIEINLGHTKKRKTI